MDIQIRNECKNDFRQVEELTREAFWDHHEPGCDEHYLVHIMRSHPDFIPELDFVAIKDDKIVGNIMYTKSYLINEENIRIDSLTFGPISVLPEYQRKGIGSLLIRHSIEKAREMRYKIIVIEGYPHDYCRHGFKGSKSLNISDRYGKFPYSLLVLELENELLKNHFWKSYFSDVYDLDENKCIEFDRLFPPKEKKIKPSHEEFRIASNAYVE